MPQKRQESSWKPIVEAVADYHQRNGYSPSVAEIAAAIGKSQTAVNFQIEKLLEDGVLIKDVGKQRSLRLAE